MRKQAVSRRKSLMTAKNNQENNREKHNFMLLPVCKYGIDSVLIFI
ncbi:Uncharacterised protein [uncultured Roseburia sp.]|nr:Uncharacterised protein [uncultured Roseburia sp.]